MNRAILLGSLFLRVSSVYASATHGDLIAEGRKRNEEAYERNLEETGWKVEKTPRHDDANSKQTKDRVPELSQPKSS